MTGRMNQSLALATMARQLATAKLRADCKRLGLKQPASPAELRRQAQAYITPELIAEARAESVRILTELRTLAPKRWAEFKDIYQ